MKHNQSRTQGSALTTFIGGIVILLAVLFLLVKLATSGYYSDVADNTPTAVETRIMPTGNLVMGDGTPAGQRSGEQVFNKVCVQCHAADSNVPNAPRLGNSGDWGPRIAKGYAVLVKSGIEGFNVAMPARGGAADLTDDEVARAVAYMTNQSGANFEAPPVSSEGESAGGDGASAPQADGKAVFDKLCVACHAANSAVPFSPKITHADDWAARIKQGKDTLFQHAINGYTGPKGGVMPAKGGNPALSDDEVKAAVVYMVNQSGGKL